MGKFKNQEEKYMNYVKYKIFNNGINKQKEKAEELYKKSKKQLYANIVNNY